MKSSPRGYSPLLSSMYAVELHITHEQTDLRGANSTPEGSNGTCVVLAHEVILLSMAIEADAGRD